MCEYTSDEVCRGCGARSCGEPLYTEMGSMSSAWVQTIRDFELDYAMKAFCR